MWAWQRQRAGWAGARAPVLLRPWLRWVEQVLFRPGMRRWWAMCAAPTAVRRMSGGRVGSQPQARGRRGGRGALGGRVSYYCHNPAVRRRVFTALPPGSVALHAERLETHVLVLQMYAWGGVCTGARGQRWAWQR